MFIVIINILNVFSKDIEIFYKNSILGSLSKEYLYVLILERNIEKECEARIKRFCNSSTILALNVEKANLLLKEICSSKKINEDCEELKIKIKKKCDDFEKDIALLKISDISAHNCSNYEHHCIILDGVCSSSSITFQCITLISKCYQNKRYELAKDLLLRGLEGHLSDFVSCLPRLIEVCDELKVESDELMQKCFFSEPTCNELLQLAYEKCSELENISKILFNVHQITIDMCRKVLNQCYFYGSNCHHEVTMYCDEFKLECENKGFKYIQPTSPFNPLTQKTEFIKKVNLFQAYKEIEVDGIVIWKTEKKDLNDILALLFHAVPDSMFEETCKHELKYKCYYIKYISPLLEKICLDGRSFVKVCKELGARLKIRILNLETKLRNLKFLNKNFDLISWKNLPNYLSFICPDLLSDCFYFGAYKVGFDKGCMNAKVACYKHGRFSIANQLLEDKLSGKFHDLLINNNECQEILIKACLTFKNMTDELFSYCLFPRKTCLFLIDDVIAKVRYLNNTLNNKLGFLEEHDCVDLETRCNKLLIDFFELFRPCQILEDSCKYQRAINNFTNVLMEESFDVLSNINNCTIYLKNKCKKWFKRIDLRFTPLCSHPNISCQEMLDNFNSYCLSFRTYLRDLEIVKKAKNRANAENICTFWQPFCYKLSPKCGFLIKNSPLQTELCEDLHNKCKPFRERKNLEDRLTYVLKDNLKDKNKCNLTLNKLCADWEESGNDTFISLCKKYPDDDAQTDLDARLKLCRKLIIRLQNQCLELRKKLIHNFDNLKKEEKRFQEIKEFAEKAIKNFNSLFLVLKNNKYINNEQNITTYNKLIQKQNLLNMKTTQDEILAFTMAAESLELYINLRKKCDNLLLNCGFKEKCSDLKEVCKNIQNICSMIKPLMQKPCTILNNTTTVSMITTTTITEKTIVTNTITKKDTIIMMTKGEMLTFTCTTDKRLENKSECIKTFTQTSILNSTIISTSIYEYTKFMTVTIDKTKKFRPNEGIRINDINSMKKVSIMMVILLMIYIYF
ncbi:uncharacterized protein T551_00327 [Pneumocystis jirovecii RU7]|uniref:Major surface glycoprotein 2 C-terminal domain-containing protein n=1 Tax=Pneumocystis jirovecii (strain RU7) TaxID=1408657 RepID=A0A0W4ZV33_PNEJ7|nr:uncharacterized protein T551_00327 [Pneumocystis jirovecii RU7]KTW32236.1 hypothetical protein T551_00327 [Pneumocystis jirovecii RU7]